MNGWNVFTEGGPMLWVIAGCGAVAIGVFAERLLHLRRARIPYADFLKGVFNILARGNAGEALAICEETPGPVACLMRTAILHREAPRELLREELENAGRAEISRMERRLALLSTIVQVTPLLGLLGTFLGALETVLTLRAQAPLVQSADLTGGLVRALAAACGGLIVAIPGYGMFNLLVIKIDRIVLDMERATSEIAALMAGERRPSATAPAAAER